MRRVVEVPGTLDLMITGRCNLACPFCYGPDPTARHELSVDEWKGLIDFVCDQGVSHFVLAGGEPTIFAGLPDVLRHLKARGAWTALQTNGSSLERVRETFEVIDWICLPVDGIDEETQSLLRTSSVHTRDVLRVIELLRAGPHRPSLKIGTVVTSANIRAIEAMARFVAELKPAVWKLYELRPRGAGRASYDALRVTKADWSELERRIAGLALGFPVALSKASESNRAYLIVNPDSRLLVPDGDFYLEFGRLLGDDGLFSMTNWVNALNALRIESQESNMRKSFAGSASTGRGRLID
ncbi:MAG: radical SAM protein, partial [Vicinamibacterales bacterium]